MNEHDLNQKLLDEIFKALRWERWPLLRIAFTPLFSTASRRFTSIANQFDQDVATQGFGEAARRLLLHFVSDVRVSGTEEIPREGPLLIVSNHPGTIDGLAIAANLPRPDLKIVVSGVPFIRHLRATARYLIYSSLDTFERMKVVLSSIRHLQEGGAVLIFPSGGIDPDPAVMPGALEALETWSPSIEVILRHVPSARVLITFVGGVLHPAWARSPITYLRRGRRNRQRVAEFFQVMYQMLLPGQLLLSPTVRFHRPLEFSCSREVPALQTIVTLAKEHFQKIQGEIR